MKFHCGSRFGRGGGMRSSAIACTAGIALCIAAPASAEVVHSSAGDLAVETVATGLTNPWALAFLPDGRLLVTERPGRLRIVGRKAQGLAGKVSPAPAGGAQGF